jgi:phosphoribosylanthranilate isomerase
MVRVKICGITNPEDARAAIEFGADALGFVFVKHSPRHVLPRDAALIIKTLPPFITAVGVFADEDPAAIETVIGETGIGIIQLHGEEPPGTCKYSHPVLKAIRVKSLQSLDPLEGYRHVVAAFLLDTYTEDQLGGTGRVFNWDIAVEAKQYGRIILAGGLTPENVSDAVRRVRPYAVDVSSGVEMEKGKKDLQKMRLFIENAKAA